jgi:hypothetical protein
LSRGSRSEERGVPHNRDGRHKAGHDVEGVTKPGDPDR